MDKKRTATELAYAKSITVLHPKLYETATAQKQDVHPCNHAEINNDYKSLRLLSLRLKLLT